VHLVGAGVGPPSSAAHSAALAGSIQDACAVAALVTCLGLVTSLVRGSAGHHAEQLEHVPPSPPAG
jgi:hypothetical protein